MAKIRNTLMVALFALSFVVGYAMTSSLSKTAPVSAEEQALRDCMDKHRWDTKAVKTSRLVVGIHFEDKGKGELAKYVSDYEAVRMVYCTPKK